MTSKRKKFDVMVRAINEDGIEGYAYIRVEAQYYRIVDGALIFRNYVGPNDYPQMVRTFAAGHWLEIIDA